ncbi:MAG: hypothetical protein ACOY71_10490 [Gemmatimonadota bacterium]
MPALIVSLLAFIVWIVLGFVTPLASGYVHLLLAVSVVLFVRWYALKNAGR